MKIPIATTSGLLSDRESGIVYCPVLEKFLIYILHFNNKLLSLVILTIDIKYSTTLIDTVAELLRIEIRYILYILLAMKHGIKKTYQQFLVEF